MVKFFDFARVVEKQGADLQSAFNRVLYSNRYVLGNEVAAFEKDFAQWSKSNWAVGCANGTDTLEIGLKVLNVGADHEVITTPLTAMPTLMGIHPTGARIRLVDVDAETGLISAADLEKAVDAKTRAIVPVHLYGQVCEMDKISELCRKKELLLLEDCAQAHGATFKGKLAGSWGDLSSWSFYPTKNLGAFGDAGALTGFRDELCVKIRAYRNYGQSSLYHHDFLGRNSRLDEVQAALLNVRLKVLDSELKSRSRIAKIYQAEFKNRMKVISGAKDTHDTNCSYHIFAVVSPYDREKFRNALKDQGVETLVHYPIPANKQKAFEHLGYGPGDFPNAEFIANQTVSLPIHPYLTEGEIDQVVQAVKAVV